MITQLLLQLFFLFIINVSQMVAGNLVYSYDTITGEVSQKEVTETYVRTSNHINYLTIVDENGNEQIIETTDSHPFWVVTDNPDLDRAAREIVSEDGTILYHKNLGVAENGYWVEAKDLKIGDVFLDANGKLSTLVSTERVEFPEGMTVYNFTVDGNHDYFVIAQTDEFGQTCILVHNAKKYENLDISVQKQDAHVTGTLENQRRDTPTTTFPDRITAEKLVSEARAKGTPLPKRPDVLEYDFKKPIGTRLNGDPTSVVRVHLTQRGKYHGYPY